METEGETVSEEIMVEFFRSNKRYNSNYERAKTHYKIENTY